MNRCPACNEPAQPGARFCPSCGASIETTRDVETCEIVWWQGYVKSEFVAVPADGGDVVSERLRSPVFRSKGNKPPLREGTAADAYAALVEILVAEGWEPGSRGRSWYSQTFSRPRGAAASASPHAVADEPLVARVDSESDRPREERKSPQIAAASSARVPVEQQRQPAPPPQSQPAPPPVPTAIVQTAQVQAHAESTAIAERGRAGPAAPVDGHRRTRRVAIAIFAAGLSGVIAAVAPSLVETRSARGNSHVLSATAGNSIPARAAGTTVVVIAAARGDSWIEARSRSETGRVLYRGMIERGQTMRFQARLVWLRLAAASNLAVLVNGNPRPLPLTGTNDLVLGPGSG